MIGDYPWDSAALLAAEVARDGTIVRANVAFERFAGRPLEGAPFADLVAPAQRDAFAERLVRAEPRWRHAPFALQGVEGSAAQDREMWMRRDDAVALIVAEPAVGEQERLVEKVLELNDDLVRAHRQLVRQREELRAAAERIRHLEAISSAGLAHVRLEEVLDDVLHAIAAAVGAERAAILLAQGASGTLEVEASIGPPEPLPVAIEEIVAHGRPHIGDGVAGVPLAYDGHVIGVLEVGSAEPGRFGEEDLGLLVPAAERAAVAISRAQVHERERAIAETLQRALLPASLPEVDGLSLAARFEPGAGVEVGGDWYDALPLPSGELVLAIGDVAGKGVRAAAVMGEIRSGLRAYAVQGGGPHEVLARLNELVTRSSQMATVVMAIVDPATGEMRYASAGHPPPLLLRPDGTATLLSGGRAAPLLAYKPAGSGLERLEPGARLVLYTDGLVERRGEAIDDGLARLVRAGTGHRGDAASLCDRLLERLHAAGAGPRDDTALIAVQRG